MSLAQTLAQLATTTRFEVAQQSLIEQQSAAVRLAISLNDVALLQKQLSADENYAHETLVVR